MKAASSIAQHGIKDNHTRGKVADFLSAKLATDSKLSVVSAYFTNLPPLTRTNYFSKESITLGE